MQHSQHFYYIRVLRIKATTIPDASQNTLKQARVLAAMSRPRNIRAQIIGIALIGLMTDVSVRGMIGLILITVLSYAAVTIYNDIQDVDTDKINGRNLPIVNGVIKPETARRFIINILALLLLPQFLITQPTGLIITGLYLLLGWLYSSPLTKFSHRGLLAQVILSVCYIVIPFVGILIVSDETVSIALISALFLLGIAGLLFKDYKDMKGDRLVGKMTPVLRYGHRTVSTTSLLIYFSALPLLMTSNLNLWMIPYAVGLICLIKTIESRASNTLALNTYLIAVSAIAVLTIV